MQGRKSPRRPRLIKLSFYPVQDEIQDVILQPRPLDARLGKVVANVGHIEPPQRIVQHRGGSRHIGDMKHPLLYPFGEDAPQERLLADVDAAPGLLHLPDVAEELGPQRTVAHHRLLDRLQPGVDVVEQLLLGRQVAVGKPLEPGIQVLRLGLDHGPIDFVLVFEIGIDRATPFPRRFTSISNSRVRTINLSLFSVAQSCKTCAKLHIFIIKNQSMHFVFQTARSAKNFNTTITI